MLPTDQGGSTGTPADSVLSRNAAGKVLIACVGGAGDALSFGTNVSLALLTGVPTLDTVSGSYSIASVELSGSGYSRIQVARATGWTGAAGGSPVKVSTLAQAATPAATADWPAINAVAVVDGSGNVIAWKSLATAIYVVAGQAARIPAGAWFFYTPSV